MMAWLLVSYLLLPEAWKAYVHRHPSFGANPRITKTGDGHPGDPLNVALVGLEEDLIASMKAAGWTRATVLSLRSDLKIGVDTVLSRPDDNAPVSSLYLFGRKEDLAFEQESGDNPRHRHHVRFWRTGETAPDGRPQWIGSAVYDKHVGFSRTTGQVTHVTSATIDVERDYMFKCLEQAGQLAEQYVVEGYHRVLQGKNGGGDPWRTDGSLYVGVLKPTAP